MPPSLLALLASTGLSLLLLAVLFGPLERAFPLRVEQPVLRAGWRTDLAFLLGQYLLFSGLVLALLEPAGRWLGAHAPARLTSGVAALPPVAQALLALLLSDLCVYWGHRLQHRVGLLWRFHAVHHSAERLDWLAAHREHPLDSVYTLGLISLPALALRVPADLLAGVAAFRGLWAIYIHSNVNLPLGPFEVLVGSPRLHQQHHAPVRDPGNYANVSPLMDVLFGTFRRPPAPPERLGLGTAFPRSYLGQLLAPLGLWPRAADGAPAGPGRIAAAAPP